MRRLTPWLVLFALGCSREDAPGKPAHAAELEPARPASASPPASARPASSAKLDPPAPSPSSGPFVIAREGGNVPAAEAARVLHVGDSMVPLVGNYLRTIFWKDGRNYWIESIPSSSTLDWGGDKRLLQDAMYRYDPDLVLISLGSNELFDPTPERRAAAIRQMVTDTRGRACLWIGPPAWKKDRGFIDVLRKNLGHCRYLDSTKLDLPRMADGRHPDWNGGYRWASAVWRELGGKGTVPTGNPRPDR